MVRWTSLPSALVAGALIAFGAFPATPEETPDEPEESKTHALLVGVTEYPRLLELLGPEKYAREVPLRGPEHDVRLFAEVVAPLLGADESRVTRLSGYGEDEATRPTRVNIMEALERLAKNVSKGDFVLILLAGHGSQQPDTSGDEADGKDEIFLPADSGEWRKIEGSVENAITDDELGAAVDAIAVRGARVWLIVDSCHSGTMRRGDVGHAALRQLDPDLLGIPAVVSRGLGDSGVRAGSMGDVGNGNVIAMYGAGSHESAPEMALPQGESDAPVRGLFSYLLARQLAMVGPGATYGQLFERIIAAYRAVPYYAATPVVEGDLSRRILDGAAQGMRLQVWEEGGDVVLNAGRLQGIDPGTLLGVYMTDRGADPGERIGRVRVLSTDLVRSACQWMDRGAHRLTGDARVCHARIEEVPESRVAIRLVVTREGEIVGLKSAPGGVQTALEHLSNQVRCVDHPADAVWSLELRDDGWRLSRRDSPGRAFEVSEDTLEDVLWRIFRAQSLFTLAGHGQTDGLPEGLDVRLIATDGTRVRSGSVLRPGSRVRLEVDNRDYESWEVWAFAMDPSYGLVKVFPPGGSALVEPSTIRDNALIFDDSTLGRENILVLAVPQGSGDLSSLSQNRLREFEVRTRGVGDKRSPLEKLLADIALGTDDMTRGARAEALGSIGASLISYEVAWETSFHPVELGADSVPRLRPRDLVGRSPAEAGLEPLRESGLRLRGDQADLYARVAPAIFAVKTRVGHGTGFLIDAKEGLVVTNNHVIDTGAGFSKRGHRTVTLVHGAIDADGVMHVVEDSVPATLVMSDPDRDLALLRIEGKPTWLTSVQALTLRDAPARVGEETVLIGHPSSGMLWTLRTGNVSSIGRNPHDMIDFVVGRLSLTAADRASLDERLARETSVKILLSSSGANPGDSGGPLLDNDGHVIGVTYAIPTEMRDDKFTYHIHRDELRAFLDRKPSPEEEARPDVPDPWRTGPNIMLDSAMVPGANDLLIGGSDKATLVMIDVDEDTKVIDVDGETKDLSRDPEALRHLVDERRFDGEMALQFRPGEMTTFYDRNNDGIYDLVLVDIDDDPNADVRFELVDGEWTVDTEVEEPLIHVALMVGLGRNLENEALKKVRAVLSR